MMLLSLIFKITLGTYSKLTLYQCFQARLHKKNHNITSHYLPYFENVYSLYHIFDTKLRGLFTSVVWVQLTITYGFGCI